MIKLERIELNSEGIFSALTVSGKVFYTLEHSYDCIPKVQPAVYKCVRGTHQLHDGIPFETFEITGVEGHSGILFHVGNYNKDSDGCVLVGEKKVGNSVVNSKKAFAEFMNLLVGIDDFELVVI